MQKHLLQPFRRQRRSSSRRGGCRLGSRRTEAGRWPKRGRPAIPTARLCWRVLRRLAAITTKALKLLEAGAATNPSGEAALELGLLQRHFGRQTAAAEHLNRVVRERFEDRRRRIALSCCARGAGARQIRDAEALYKAAVRSGDPAVETAGELFLETDNLARSAEVISDRHQGRRELGPGTCRRGKTIAGENPPMAAAAAEEALKIDPDLADAHLFLAGLDLDNTLRRGAGTDRARPQDQSIASRRAGASGRDRLRPRRQSDVRRRDGARAGHQPELRRGLSRRRRSGRRVYRFDEAVALTRRALELSPSNTRAQSDLGLHLMRTGDEAEASPPRPLIQGLPMRRRHRQPARAARQAGEVRRRPRRRSRAQVRSERNDGAARVRGSAGPRSAGKTVGHLPVHAEGPILIEISRSTMTSRFATSVCLDLSARSAPASAAS